MPIETEIKGSPASIRSAATWLTGTLAPALQGGADRMVGARRTAGADWLGETGTAFCGAMSRGVLEVEDVCTTAEDVGAVFDEYAGALQSCQSRMQDLRGRATAGGLSVSATAILEPGAGPACPARPAEFTTQAQVDGYETAVAAYNAHQEKVRLYNLLAEEAAQVWTDMTRAYERVAAKDRALDGASWAFTLSDVAGGLGGAVNELHRSLLRADAEYFKNHADEALARLREAAQRGRVPNAAQFYDDLDHYTNLARGSEQTIDDASRAMRLGKLAPIALGGALALGGTWYDYTHGGESLEQAAASNLGGFAASVATGAAVGTMIGGPVGTAAGAVVGAGVGVFTSGMIDGLFESGGDVTDAVSAGVDTLVDTGGALVDAGGAIVDGIGGLFG